MRLLLHAIYDVPDLIRQIFAGKYALIAVLVIIVYLIVMFIDNKVTRPIRECLILAASVFAVIAYFKRRYSFVWLMLILLALLLVVRFLCYMLVTIRIRRRNRKIEKRALEKAAMRRGSWKEKRGYSGVRKEDDEPVSMPAMNRDEIADVLENETSEREGANLDLRVSPEVRAAGSRQNDAAESEEISRAVVQDAVRKLEDLRALGVLTDEELTQKKEMLYRRMR